MLSGGTQRRARANEAKPPYQSEVTNIEYFILLRENLSINILNINFVSKYYNPRPLRKLFNHTLN